jgi:hypothetical protein
MSKTFNRRNVRMFMKDVEEQHYNPNTGAVDITSLAEAAAAFFEDADDFESPLDDETHWIWDMAAQIAEEAKQP